MCDNVVALSLRKALGRELDKVSELAEKVCTEAIDKEFSEMLTFTVQYLSTRKVSQELNVECVPCGMHQGDKVVSSTRRELTRSKDDVIVNMLPQVLEIMSKLWNMVKHFESNNTNRKNYYLVLQDHRCLLTNEFKRYLNETRFSSV